jgi:hypothetical protein
MRFVSHKRGGGGGGFQITEIGKGVYSTARMASNFGEKAFGSACKKSGKILRKNV